MHRDFVQNLWTGTLRLTTSDEALAKNKEKLYPPRRRFAIAQKFACTFEIELDCTALHQGGERLSKAALLLNNRYAHARQMKRAKRERKRLGMIVSMVVISIMEITL